MALLSRDPFEGLLRLQRDLERSLAAPVMNFGWAGANVFPPVNVFSDKDGFVIRAEVTGVKPDQIEITLEPRRLTLKGERAAEEHKKEGGYHRRERPFGQFSRSMQLPEDLDTGKAKAERRNGLLTIRIPKAEAAKPKQIKIKAA